MNDIFKMQPQQINDTSYIGQLVDDKKNGVGKLEWKDAETHQTAFYLGQFKEDTKQGFGKLVKTPADYFLGLFEDDQPTGTGLAVQSGKITQFCKKLKNGAKTNLLEQISCEDQQRAKKKLELVFAQVCTYYEAACNIEALYDDADFRLNFLRFEREKLFQIIEKAESEIQQIVEISVENQIIVKQFEPYRSKTIPVAGGNYTGQFRDQHIFGIGKYLLSNKDYYLGQFDQCRCGFGFFKRADNFQKIGFWANGTMTGLGFKLDDKEKIVEFGEYFDNKLIKNHTGVLQNEFVTYILGKYLTIAKYIEYYFGNMLQIDQLYKNDQQRFSYLQNEREKIEQLVLNLQIEQQEKIKKYFEENKQEIGLNALRKKTICINENSYHGQVCNNQPFGLGSYTWPDNAQFLGWFQPKRVGFGVFSFNNGSKQIGFWKDDKPSGVSFNINQKGKVEQLGEFIEGQMTTNLLKLMTDQHVQQLLQLFKQYFEELQNHFQTVDSNIQVIQNIQDKQQQDDKINELVHFQKTLYLKQTHLSATRYFRETFYPQIIENHNKQYQYQQQVQHQSHEILSLKAEVEKLNKLLESSQLEVSEVKQYLTKKNTEENQKSEIDIKKENQKLNDE